MTWRDWSAFCLGLTFVHALQYLWYTILQVYQTPDWTIAFGTWLLTLYCWYQHKKEEDDGLE